MSRATRQLRAAAAGVTGFENLSSAAALQRQRHAAAHQLLDRRQHEHPDRAGLRLLPVSEVMVREVKVVTSGYAPEFGQTTGLVYNAITPSGTNTVHGDGSYRFRRKDMSARPFFLNNPSNIPGGTPYKPDTHVDTVTLTFGGPIVKDKLHYYFGFENTARDLSADRVITIAGGRDAHRPDAGGEPGAIPAEQTARFFIGKVDYQINTTNRLTARCIRSATTRRTTSGDGRHAEFHGVVDGFPTRWTRRRRSSSRASAARCRTRRVQYAHRHQSRTTNGLSGTGPALTISGVANFGGPFSGAQDAEFDFKQNIWQVIDNFTFLKGDHSIKTGFDPQFVQAPAPPRRACRRVLDHRQLPRGSSGTNRYAYSTFLQFLADRLRDDTSLFSALSRTTGASPDVQDALRPAHDSTAI
jgi:hypothetical protein